MADPGVSVRSGADAGGREVSVVQTGVVALCGREGGDRQVCEVLVEADPLGGGGPASRHTELSLLHWRGRQAEGTHQAVEHEAVVYLDQGEVPVNQVLRPPGQRVAQDGLHQLDLCRLAGRGVVA